MTERSEERNGVPLRGLGGGTDLMTFQGEIALGLLARMWKRIRFWKGLLLSELDRYQSPVDGDFLIQLVAFCGSEGCFRKGRLHPWGLSLGDLCVLKKIKEAFEHSPLVYWNALAFFPFRYCFKKGLSLKPEHSSNILQ